MAFFSMEMMEDVIDFFIGCFDLFLWKNFNNLSNEDLFNEDLIVCCWGGTGDGDGDLILSDAFAGSKLWKNLP